jgi:metallo-beta-lactamase class B
MPHIIDRPSPRDGYTRVLARTSAAIVAGSAIVFAGSAGAIPANWTEPQKPFHVIDNVYYVGSAGLSSWLIVTPRGLILLDVGEPQNASMVEANIETLGYHVKDIRILLNSHAHHDHSGGLAKLKADSGAKLYASEGDRPALEAGVYPGWESRKDLDFPPVKVDHVLEDGEKVSLGGTTLTVVATPGHTAGCTSYLLPVTDQGTKHTAFFFCSASVALNRLAPDPQYPGIVDNYRKTFARLGTLHADVFLAPHAEMYDLPGKLAKVQPGQPSPFVHPGDLEASAAGFERDFEQALKAQSVRK